VVTVKYRETNPLRSASLYFRQQAHALSAGKVVQLTWSAHPVLTTTLACMLAAVFIVAGMQYVRRDSASNVPPASTKTQLAGSSAQGENNIPQTTTQNSLNPSRAEASKIDGGQKPRVSSTVEKNKEKESVAANPVPSDHEGVISSEKSGSEAESTRSLGTGPAAVSLSNVRKIYVRILGNLPANDSLHNKLIEDLRGGNRFVPAQNRDEADALMKVSYRKSVDMRPDTASAFVQLINARGDIIWPTARTRSGGNYRGSVATMSRNIVKDLLGESPSLQKER
jgi:hypothetical protein